MNPRIHIEGFSSVSFRAQMYIPNGLDHRNNCRRNCNCLRSNSNHHCLHHILDHCNNRHRRLGNTIPRDKVWQQVPRTIPVRPQSAHLFPRQMKNCQVLTMVSAPTSTKRPRLFAWEQTPSALNGVGRILVWTKRPRTEREWSTS